MKRDCVAVAAAVKPRPLTRYRWVFGVKLSDEDIVEIECLRVVAMSRNYGTKIAITGFV